MPLYIFLFGKMKMLGCLDADRKRQAESMQLNPKQFTFSFKTLTVVKDE